MAKIRGKNEGSIHKRDNGTWRVQVSIQGQRLSFTAATHKEAKDWLRRTLNQVDDGLVFASTQITLNKFLDSWLVSSQASMRHRSWEHYAQLLRSHIRPYLGSIKLKDLRPNHIQSLYNLLLEQKIGKHTIAKVHTLLHAALEQAIKLGLSSSNPANGARAPRPPVKELQILDEGQASQLLLVARSTRLETLLHLALSTGMRQMELLGLKWDDLDWLKKTIQVVRQLDRPNGDQVRFIQPKTRNGCRTIDLGPQTIAALRLHEQRLFEEKKAAGENWIENGLIFSTSVGTPIHPRNLLRDYKRVLRKAGLPDIRFHDLRHTAASLMLNHNVPVIVVSRRLGHARASITLDIYGHLIPGMQTEAAQIIDNLITPVELQRSFSLHPTAPDLHPTAPDSKNKTY